jgi:thiamine phosphate synthase YjbQ (UPF0047 family)
MLWVQRVIRLAAKPRGIHLVTEEILAQLPELERVRVGLLHVFLQHTSIFAAYQRELGNQ